MAQDEGTGRGRHRDVRWVQVPMLSRRWDSGRPSTDGRCPRRRPSSMTAASCAARALGSRVDDVVPHAEFARSYRRSRVRRRGRSSSLRISRRPLSSGKKPSRTRAFAAPRSGAHLVQVVLRVVLGAPERGTPVSMTAAWTCVSVLVAQQRRAFRQARDLIEMHDERIEDRRLSRRRRRGSARRLSADVAGDTPLASQGSRPPPLRPPVMQLNPPAASPACRPRLYLSARAKRSWLATLGSSTW